MDGAFVDGGVSPFNDPALQTLLVATLQGHGFRWQGGADNILLVSVGTGTHEAKFSAQSVLNMIPAQQGLRALQSLMDDCAVASQMMLQWLTHCLTPWLIDRAVGDMKLDSQAGPRLATYVRYNVLLEAGWIKDQLGISSTPERLAKLAKMDEPANMDELAVLGREAAKIQVSVDHFPAQFDICPGRMP
ncbi:hypothetical protein [Paraburkholderia sp. SIMBA_054]|uniref:hypothetical protein n=1 Tax=Paraburkholderia sp. SIMBA_054 TaxID=3085795 RepID=UPI00397E3061